MVPASAQVIKVLSVEVPIISGLLKASRANDEGRSSVTSNHNPVRTLIYLKSLIKADQSKPQVANLARPYADLPEKPDKS